MTFDIANKMDANKMYENENENFNEKVLKEIQKYDIYNWTQDTIIKRDTIYISTNNINPPTIDNLKSELYIMHTNNYDKVYDTSTKKDIWDIEYCGSNQMGKDRTNPNNLDKCVYINKRNQTKEYKNTWKNTLYNNSKELSLYNPKKYLNKLNNQIFYPVGTVWTGKINPTNNPNGVGPKKSTILVSGNVKPPESYKKMWDSDSGCTKCHNNRTIILRPKAPKNYVSLGDVAIKIDKSEVNANLNDSELQKIIDEKLEKLEIMCVPKSCVIKKNIGYKVWDNRNVSYEEYNSYNNYTSKTPQVYQKQLNVSLWSAGASNCGEEFNNNYGIALDEDGGYNLFRISQILNEKPKLNSYIIKERCLQKNYGKTPINYELKYNLENPSKKRHDTNNLFGKKPKNALLTNYTKLNDNLNNYSIYNDKEQSIKYYLEDDLNKRKEKENGNGEFEPDTYFIKTFNYDKNDFSNCLVTDRFGNLFDSKNCDKNNKYHLWNVNYDDEHKDKATNSANVTLKTHALVPKKDSNNKIIPDEDKTNQCLIHYYDNLGNGINKLVDCDDISGLGKTTSDSDIKFNWSYDTITKEELPKK